MRQPYEPPEIELLGSVIEETQGFRFTAQQDSIFGVNVPFGGSPVHS
ncbi:hypothetical protein [Pseudonocardia broussonetiae]|uniref:Lasso RiPP family leader peptide-containing protein n=1 Tax=Pseudonocardia broussonetiae TaxID=2736640 RepID=A0A6M6JJ58_9PSEU|nr:hypothetical protein [Pseudonocardia broussonetiae]QJY47040.1 hypothetical protein HOP40_15495 [Pseudonocardia broussonetiae]